jgi:hypothetical protein
MADRAFLRLESRMGRKDTAARTQDQRFDLIRKELMRRMRPVCQNMPDALFLDLIERMATVQIKYELKGTQAAD